MKPEKLPFKTNLLYGSGILILFSLIAFPFLSKIGLWNPLEPRYASIAKNMYLSHDWCVLKYLDQIYLQKPPLYFWLINLCYWVTGGISIWAARLPSILATLLCLVGIYQLGKRIYGDRVAWLSTLIFLLNFRVLYQVRRIQMEMILLATSIWAIYCLIKVFDEPKSYSRGRWLYGFYFLTGIGILVKGLVALVPLLITALLAAFFSKKLSIKDLLLGRGLLIIILITGLWLVPAFRGNLHWEHVRSLFEIGVGNFVSFPSKHGPFYYLQVLLVEYLPWSIFFPFACFSTWRNRNRLSFSQSRIL